MHILSIGSFKFRNCTYGELKNSYFKMGTWLIFLTRVFDLILGNGCSRGVKIIFVADLGMQEFRVGGKFNLGH